MKKLSEILLYIFCFFPFVKFIPLSLETDTQPWALIYSCMLFIFIVAEEKKIKIPKKFLYIILLALIGILINITFEKLLPKNCFNISSNNFNMVRNLASTVSMIVISYVSYYMFSKAEIDEKYIKIIINIYLFIGLIQKFIYKKFLYFLVAGARTSSNRGVIALASEPSFYAYICIFLLFFVYEFKKGKKFYLVNLLFQIIFLAESTVGLVYLSVLLFFYIVKKMSLLDVKKQIKYSILILVGILFIVILLYYLSIKMKNQRIGMFLGILFSGRDLSGIWNRLLLDRSFSERLNNITGSIGAFFLDYGLPHGFNVKRISSGWGNLLYQYGFLGLIILFFIFIIIKKAYSSTESGRAFSYTIMVIMFSTIQFNSPIVWFYLGYCLSKLHRNREIKKTNDPII